MSRLIPGAGLDRTDIETPFSVHSLSSAAVAGHGADRQVLRILPEVNVIKIGGQSIMDRGTRARHAYAIALDLGMPTSVLAKIGAHVPVQNARMLQLLLAQDGGILIDHEAVGHLPLYYRMGCVPILPGMPPFSFWEPPARVGRIPTHRTDAGVWLTAEGLGARRCIFVKDEDGLYTANPKDDPRATFIPRIHAAELLARKLPDCVVEPVVLEYMLRARLVREIQIINGLKPGTLTRALAGEPVGTIIHAD